MQRPDSPWRTSQETQPRPAKNKKPRLSGRKLRFSKPNAHHKRYRTSIRTYLIRTHMQIVAYLRKINPYRSTRKTCSSEKRNLRPPASLFLRLRRAKAIFSSKAASLRGTSAQPKLKQTTGSCDGPDNSPSTKRIPQTCRNCPSARPYGR